MNLEQAVYTTKQILINKLPILYVIRDEGEWQFLGGQEVEMDDLLIVPLKEIINYDETIKTILHIKNGMEAARSTPDDDWIIIKS